MAVPCCLPDNTCLLLEPSTCFLRGGRDLSPATTCAVVNCALPFGACCWRNNFGGVQCFDNLTRIECETLNPRGAYLVGAACSSGIDCNQSFVPVACCNEGICTMVPEVDCRFAGGVSLPGEFCLNVVCPPPAVRSACCFDDGACIDDVSEARCSEFIPPGRFVLGPDQTPLLCGVDTCSIPNPGDGACCIDGVCSITSLDECRINGGLFVQNTPCSQIDCTLSNVAGACCLPSGQCVTAESRRACDALRGLFYPWVACNFVNCQNRACCLDGNCFLASPAICEGVGGFGGVSWRDRLCEGPGGVPIKCGTRACCFDDQSPCQNLTTTECINQGGVFQEEFTQCSFPTVHCDALRGAACCFPDGSCQRMTEVTCNSLGGFWRRSDSCPEFPDDPSPCIPTACCLPDNTCENTNRRQCDVRIGYWYNGKTCDEVDCATGETPRYFDYVGKLAPSGMTWGLDLCQWALFEPVLVFDDDNYCRLQTLHPVRAVEPNWSSDTMTIFPGEPCGYHWGDMGMDSEGFAEPRFCSKPSHGNARFDQTTVMKAYTQRIGGLPPGTILPDYDRNQGDGFTAFGGLYHTPYWVEASYNSALRLCEEAFR